MRIRTALAIASSAAILSLGLTAPAVAAAPASPASASAPAPSASPAVSGQRCPDLGQLCERLQRVPAKTPLCTHGGDPLRPRAAAPSTSTSPTVAATPADLCTDGGVSGRRIEVLYAVPRDRPNRYSQLLPTMRKVLLEADQNLDDSGASTTQHYRFLCENGADVTIRNVTLKPLGSERFYFWDYVDSLQRQVELGLGPRNFLASNRIYMAFVDQVSDVYDYGGEANIFWTTSPTRLRT